MEPVRIGHSLPSLESETSAAPAEIKPKASAESVALPTAQSTTSSSAAGQVFQPSAGDEVLISFKPGDLRAPYVTGGLWNADAPPTDAGPAAGHEDTRLSEERAKLLEHQLKNLK